MNKTISQETRKQVYNKYEGHCAYCGKKIDYKDMQIDHLIPQCELKSQKPKYSSEQINCIDNYMPTCRRCNHYKRGNSLNTFREMIRTIPSKLQRDNYIFNVANDFEIFKVPNISDDSINPQYIHFYFEEMNGYYNIPIYNCLNGSIEEIGYIKRYTNENVILNGIRVTNLEDIEIYSIFLNELANTNKTFDEIINEYQMGLVLYENTSVPLGHGLLLYHPMKHNYYLTLTNGWLCSNQYITIKEYVSNHKDKTIWKIDES